MVMMNDEEKYLGLVNAVLGKLPKEQAARIRLRLQKI